jgi:hypothetical protein
MGQDERLEAGLQLVVEEFMRVAPYATGYDRIKDKKQDRTGWGRMNG